jgi:hypothetical protein
VLHCRASRTGPQDAIHPRLGRHIGVLIAYSILTSRLIASDLGRLNVGGNSTIIDLLQRVSAGPRTIGPRKTLNVRFNLYTQPQRVGLAFDLGLLAEAMVF